MLKDYAKKAGVKVATSHMSLSTVYDSHHELHNPEARDRTSGPSVRGTDIAVDKSALHRCMTPDSKRTP